MFPLSLLAAVLSHDPVTDHERNSQAGSTQTKNLSFKIPYFLITEPLQTGIWQLINQNEFYVTPRVLGVSPNFRVCFGGSLMPKKAVFKEEI